MNDASLGDHPQGSPIPAIEVRGFSKHYDGRPAVDGLDFTLAGGEILGLVGPNGAGKTTTLRALAGIIQPSLGSLRIAGHDIVHDPLRAKAALAFVPDDPQLFPNLTVFEHLELSARLYGVREHEKRAHSLLHRFVLSDRVHSMADELSRGMRQKLAIACGLLHEPRVLMLDEPLTGLDPLGIREIFAAIHEAAERGAAVLLSSHLLSQIEPHCTRFLILAGGHRLFLGSKPEIQSQLPALQANASLEEIFFQATGAPPAPPSA